MALFDVDGALYREAELGYEPTFFQAPVYSPDGEHFVVAAERLQGESALVLASSDGHLVSTLADLDSVVAFDWSPETSFMNSSP